MCVCVCVCVRVLREGFPKNPYFEFYSTRTWAYAVMN